MRVKVCGITNLDDALLALRLGADALGFNFFPRSPRYIDPISAAAIIRRLPPLATMVGVFVNVDSPKELQTMARASGVRVLQLHGDESPEYCNELSDWPIIKVVRVGEGNLNDDLDRYKVQAFLLDSRDDVLFGGTGKTFDWKAVAAIGLSRPLILAGGLNPGNVAGAIRAADPYAVDVCSGVELSPGRKDPQALKRFMEEVANAGR